MGLDGLDLKFRLERAFHISIDRLEMMPLFNSPGKTHEFIWHRLQGNHPACRSEPTPLFDEVHAAIRDLSSFRRRLFLFSKPTFERMILPQARVQSWEMLSNRLNVTLPPLDERDPLVPLFPKECNTERALCHWMWRNCEDRLSIQREEFREAPPEGADQWTRESSWKKVQEIIADCLDVSLDKVTPDASMSEDLGMD